jgi:AcrR family transcriptional regulator
MPRGDKQQGIMRAAERLFSSRRYHEVTTDDIAQAARVGKGTIYRYFKDKDDLFFQVATSGFEELCSLLSSKVPENAPAGEQLLSACTEISSFFQGRRELLRVMQAEDSRMQWCRKNLRERWLTKRKGLTAAVAAILSKGVQNGEFRPDVPPEAMAHYLLGMLRTRARNLADAPADMRGLELMLELFRTGAGCPQPVTAARRER